jgi:hypothetical protein
MLHGLYSTSSMRYILIRAISSPKPQNPGPDHLGAAYRCVDYLEDTKYLAHEYGGDVPSKQVFLASTGDDERTAGPLFRSFNASWANVAETAR